MDKNSGRQNPSQRQTICRQQWPINFRLWKNAVELGKSLSRIPSETSSAMEIARSWYQGYLEQCNSEKDLQELEAYYERMGYIPKVPKRKKQKVYLCRSKKVGKRQARNA